MQTQSRLTELAWLRVCSLPDLLKLIKMGMRNGVMARDELYIRAIILGFTEREIANIVLSDGIEELIKRMQEVTEKEGVVGTLFSQKN